MARVLSKIEEFIAEEIFERGRAPRIAAFHAVNRFADVEARLVGTALVMIAHQVEQSALILNSDRKVLAPALYKTAAMFAADVWAAGRGQRVVCAELLAFWGDGERYFVAAPER